MTPKVEGRFPVGAFPSPLPSEHRQLEGPAGLYVEREGLETGTSTRWSCWLLPIDAKSPQFRVKVVLWLYHHRLHWVKGELKMIMNLKNNGFCQLWLLLPFLSLQSCAPQVNKD